MKPPRLALFLVLIVFSATSAPAFGEPAEKPPPAITGPKPAPIDPPSSDELEAGIRRGVDFLLGYQNKNGSWGSARRTKGLNIYAPVPGAHHAFRAAVTSLCLSALIEEERQDERVTVAIDQGESWLLENLPKVRRATPDAIYNNWTHGYSIQTLALLARRRADDADYQERIRSLVEQQIDLLGRYESVDGGWGYYDFRAGTKQPASSSTSFMTAMTLVTLRDAEKMGVDVPEKLVRRAIDSIHRQQKRDFTYLYGEYLKWQPVLGINRPGGSLGRSQACNVALRIWGDERITDHVLKVWLDRLYARNDWLGIGRKRPIPHEAWFQVAGYFYYFGHYYAALCIVQLPEEERPYFQGHLAHILLPLQEKDGSWWDYPFYDYHQPYGTAFALLSLTRCRQSAGP